jgi:NADH:ubiquinone oxidoreductase subunit 6 (subunit J)
MTKPFSMKANQKFKGLKEDRDGYTQVVGGLIALLVVIGVGAMIFFQITDSFAGTSNESNEAMEGVQDMGETIFGLLPIIALVIVASIIIAVVVGMGGDVTRRF